MGQHVGYTIIIQSGLKISNVLPKYDIIFQLSRGVSAFQREVLLTTFLEFKISDFKLELVCIVCQRNFSLF